MNGYLGQKSVQFVVVKQYDEISYFRTDNLQLIN